MTTSATAAAAAKIAKPKKVKNVSHAKQEQAALPLPTTDPAPEFGNIDPSQIIVLGQVRTEFDEESLRELAEDIADRGILQPLTVRKTEEGFVLVAGERRLRAAKLAGLQVVPVLVSRMSVDEHHAAQLAENIQREDLTTLETAKAIKMLHDLGHSVSEIANQVHKSKSWVSKRLAAANPNLSWQARKILEEGMTEDLELVLTVDQVAKLDYYEGQQLVTAIGQGKAGRETAREKLVTVKAKEAARQAQREAMEAERNDPEYQAKRKAEQEAAEARWEARQEEERQKAHIEPDTLMARFWDWCGENEEAGSAYLVKLDEAQLASLNHAIDLWYAAGQGMNLSTLAKRLTKEYVHADATYTRGTAPWSIALMTFAVTAVMKPMDMLGAFLDWYAAELVRPEQAGQENE